MSYYSNRRYNPPPEWKLMPHGGHPHPIKTCTNCAHSTSTDPKCGLCVGPNATITRYIKHEAHTD